MPEFAVPILSIEVVTHDVKAYRVQKPSGYRFQPGQATEVAVDKPGWETETRPFTFTSRGHDEALEFTIKSYRGHDGVTKLLDTLAVGDRLVLHDVWGALTYRGSGLFLAGGAGITPFLAILRALGDQHAVTGNRLLYSNKTPADVIREAELRSLLKSDFVSRIGMIDEALLTEELKRDPEHIYLCGPDPMMDALSAVIRQAGFGDRLIVED